MKIKRFSWTWSFVTKDTVHQVTLKSLHIYILTGFIFLIFSVSSLLTLGSVKKHSLYSEYKKQQITKQRYIDSLKKLDTDLDGLSEQLDFYSSFDDRLRFSIDASSLERDLRVAGIGGPSPLDTLKGRLNKASYRVVSDVVKNANFTERLVDLEKISYDEIYEKLISVVDLKRHTPSVWPTHGYISSRFGYRRHPIRKTIEFHQGVDIANHMGTPIYASADGVVDFAGRLAGYGNYISIDHGYGFKTKYGHLQKIVVKKGEKVRRGDLIAKMGRTGLATGSHLHYEVRIINKPVNPLGYIIRDTLTY